MLAFVAASAVLVVVPGPNVVYIVTRGVTQGRGAAVVSTLGVEAGMLVHVAAAATGLSAILTRTALTFTMVKLAGAAYLLFLAVRAVRAAPSGPDAAPRPARRRASLFRQGFLASVLNPKVAVFFLAFLPQFVRPAAGGVLEQTLVLGGLFLAVATVSDLGYALLSGSVGRRTVGAVRRARRWRDAEAAVYAGLGVALAVAGTDDA
ncbi:MAG: LysE family translocator [Actinobacteria bacterium]|nr:LysE family translocator [Actinomycetota bacterium]